MKHLFRNLFIATFALTAGMFASCSSDDNNKIIDDKKAVQINKKNDTALLLCSFGSSYEQPQQTYKEIIKDFQKKYPKTDIYMAFTSSTIVNKVYADIQKAYAKPTTWFDPLAEAGYKTIYTQSLHIIPGEEYQKLDGEINEKLAEKYPDIKVVKGSCLLETEEDINNVATILYNYYKPHLDKGEVVAFMGHGNDKGENYKEANEHYTKLEQKLQELSGKKNIFIGTVDWPKMMFGHVRDGIIAYAKEKGLEEKEYSKLIVNLAPLMSIAGDHAQNDMLGGLEEGQKASDVDPFEEDFDGEEPCAEFSWILKLEKLGFTINEEGSLTDDKNFNVIGLGDHSEIRAIWVDHLNNAIKAK